MVFTENTRLAKFTLPYDLVSNVPRSCNFFPIYISPRIHSPFATFRIDMQPSKPIYMWSRREKTLASRIIRERSRNPEGWKLTSVDAARKTHR